MTSEANPTEARFVLRGEAVVLDSSGIAFLPEHGVLVVADLHLEKGASLAARGRLLPPYDSVETLRRLLAVIAARRPRRLVLLGDSFHSAIHTLDRQPEARGLIAEIAAATDIIWIAGNHDPELPLALPGVAAAEMRIGGLALRHEPGADGMPEIIGHLHPAARISTRAGSQRRKCFVISEARLLMPAFGALTGSLDVSDPAISTLFPGNSARACLCGSALGVFPLDAVCRDQSRRKTRLAIQPSTMAMVTVKIA